MTKNAFLGTIFITHLDQHHCRYFNKAFFMQGCLSGVSSINLPLLLENISLLLRLEMSFINNGTPPNFSVLEGEPK